MSVRILIGDVRDRLKELPDASVHCCVTSPPYYGLRDYGCAGQIGLEKTPDEYVAQLVAVFREVRRVLRNDGTLWLNVGDSYAGSAPGKNGFRPGNPEKNGGASNRDGLGPIAGLRPKDLIGIPWMLAFALRADGWYLRQDIIWSKPNPMPESVTDRCTKAHEYLFLLSKSARYYYDQDAIAEAAVDPESLRGRNPRNHDKFAKHDPDGFARTRKGFAKIEAGKIYETRNRRSVWEITTQPFSEAHFATFPPALVEPCIKAACPIVGTVLDPFSGAGTTALVADRLNRNAICIELNPGYAGMSRNRVYDDLPLFAAVAMEMSNA